jgi:hypothetical protein
LIASFCFSQSFGRRKLEEANQKYTEFEEEIASGRNLNVVLVATKSIETLIHI